MSGTVCPGSVHEQPLFCLKNNLFLVTTLLVLSLGQLDTWIICPLKYCHALLLGRGGPGGGVVLAFWKL